MQLSQSATVVTIGLLFAGAYCSAQDRSASSSQRYRIHVPAEVKFARVERAAVADEAAQQLQADAAPLAFMADTTSGLTIQFETQSASLQQSPLKLTLSGSQSGNWSASVTSDVTATAHKAVAEGTSVQASTPGAGWTNLTIDVVGRSAETGETDETLTTIVVTIVAH